MSHRKPKICLVEPCHSHEEVLLPLVDLLRDEYDVHVLAPQSLLDVDLLRRTSHLYQGLAFPWNQQSSRLQRALSMPGKYRKIREMVDAIAPEITLFNSTYALPDLLLIVRAFRGVRKAQIIHNFQYYLRPGMRRLYAQFDANLVISEQVQGHVVAHHPQYASLDYVLPIDFSAFEATVPPAGPGETDERVQFGVFGSIERRRRNYDGLFASLIRWAAGNAEPKFVLHLLGKLPAEYQALLRKHDLERVVRYHPDVVSFEEMFRMLRRVDVVLFLIDSTVRDCAVYNHYKITGTSTLVKGFRKACAASRDFCVDALLADKCFFYDGPQIEQLFQAVAEGSLSKAAVHAKEASYAGMKIFTREEQQARLLRRLHQVSRQTPAK